MRNAGIVGTNSPLILTASVTFGNGVSGLVYVGQSVITAILAVKSTIERRTSDPSCKWQVGVWDTREPYGDWISTYEGTNVPDLDDVRRISEGMDHYLVTSR